MIDVSLFVRGMDSLQVLQLTRKLQHIICGDIAPSMIYANFTVRLLARAIHKLLSQEQITEDNRATASEQAMADTFETHKKYIDRYYNDFPDPADRLEVRHPDGKFDSSASENSEIVLLIGSTGALGANMLSVL